jgi:hypothetical protein
VVLGPKVAGQEVLREGRVSRLCRPGEESQDGGRDPPVRWSVREPCDETAQGPVEARVRPPSLFSKGTHARLEDFFADFEQRDSSKARGIGKRLDAGRVMYVCEYKIF